MLPAGNLSRGPPLWRAAPLCACPGPRPRIQGGRAGHPSSAPTLRAVEVRHVPVREGLSGPVDGQVPDGVWAATSTCPGDDGPVALRAGRPGARGAEPAMGGL